MQEIPFILTEWQEINSLLYTPLSATKKIQYTCMTVSNNYIVLGAISGSIYLFTREPCVFQQLIPLTEGAVHRAQISPDERTIALATVKGNVCLVTLKPSIKLTAVSTEHAREKVTCLCWNDSSTEVYVGDESGKVSVLILSSFTINAMFPSSSYVLMNLDSKIVQMNFVSNLLLISTLNRCYICDTVQELYKQIGNKPRDGEFGACFLKIHVTNGEIRAEAERQDYVSNAKKKFSMSGELDHDTRSKECFPKIYCARPGSRLWEVTANGTVIKTHQFKEALAIAPLPVYKPSIGKLLKLRKQTHKWPIQSINFAQLFVISCKYIFSYTSNGLYILDPENAQVVLWNDEFPDIFIAHIINDKIYLMTFSGVFHCLTLTSVNLLILQLYDKKLYNECWEVCQMLRSQLVNYVAQKSSVIDIKQNIDLSKILKSIIFFINSNHRSQTVKHESGIVIVNAANKDFNNMISTIDKEVVDLKNSDELNVSLASLNINDVSNSLVECAQTNDEENTSDEKYPISNKSYESRVQKVTKTSEVSLQTSICNIQTDLESLNLSINLHLRPDMTEEQLKQIVELLIESLDNMKRKYEISNALQNYLLEVIHSAEVHYYNNLLENLPIQLLHKIENVNLLKLLVKIFIDVNLPNYIECSCGFPYPIFSNQISKFLEPKFIELGKILLDKLSVNEYNSCLQLCNQIPYFWRDYLFLKEYTTKRIPDSLLKQCLQINDDIVLSMIFPTLDERQWKVVAQCFESIQKGRCVNCSKYYNSDQILSKEFIVDWHNIIHLLVKKEGPSGAIALLWKVNKNLPQISFDKSVYQSIIFSSILNQHGVTHTIELDHANIGHNSVCSPKVSQEVVGAMEKDVGKRINKELLGLGPHHWGMQYNPVLSVCPCCTLSLQTPVLLENNGVALFPCGHAYHVNCMIQKKISRCNLIHN